MKYLCYTSQSANGGGVGTRRGGCVKYSNQSRCTEVAFQLSRRVEALGKSLSSLRSFSLDLTIPSYAFVLGLVRGGGQRNIIFEGGKCSRGEEEGLLRHESGAKRDVPDLGVAPESCT